ncbi:MAG: hypothetical protein Q8P41_17305 [Pseudomonadota bacterium]|nr:hypothetical protein [Pseudomonadota bacterium]
MTLFLPLLLTVFTPSASAGERLFAYSYGYGTVPRGGVEVEHYATAQEDGGGTEWAHQVELEYGITDQLEAGLYLVAEQPAAGALAFAGYKARLKYRFGSAGVGPVDTAIYFEYIGSPAFDTHGVEAKLIFGKTLGSFEAALNAEYKLTFGEGLEHEIEPTLGLGYKITPHFLLGAEVRNEIEWAGTEPAGVFLWAGPTVHLAGEGGKLWWTLTTLFATTNATRDDHAYIVRSLVAVNL